MGRPERPLDPAAGPIQRLAQQLRELRVTAGSPSYRSMAQSAGFSATTLSDAAAGQRLPSLAVVRGYVQACAGDPAEWDLRWKEASTEAAGAVREDEESAVTVPYRGLARYEPADRQLFFGRDRLLDEVSEMVCGNRFAVLFGASGSGKSSLLRAGLVPRLQERIAARKEPAALRILAPGARPATTYGHLLTPAEGEPESWVVVDQFEEVFTLCRDEAERARFIDLLLTARDPASRLRVVVAVRSDFAARCAEYRQQTNSLREASLLVGPMTADELRDAVVRPAQAAGLLVERELTARIIDEVLDWPGALPMLSHALLETWKRRRSRLLTLAAYEAAGGVRGAIAATADEVYEQMTPASAVVARRLLLRLIEPGRGTVDTRRPLTRSELADWVDPEVPAVVERLACARLLTVNEDGVQLAHDALITCWPRLRDWVDEEREQLRHHRRLTEAAQTWLEHDRDPGALYRGSRLSHAEEFFLDRDSGLTTTERTFLTSAVQARDTEGRAATRTARRARLLITTLSAVLAVALVSGLVAWQQHRDDLRRTTDDDARRAAQAADSLRTTDPRTAMLLGVAAWRVSQLPEARRALLSALDQPEAAAFADPDPGDAALRFLVDSGRALLSIDGRTWHRWALTGGSPATSGRLPAGDVLAVEPTGRVIAFEEGNGIRLWDTASGQWIGSLRTAPSVATVTFTTDGRDYLVGGLGDRLELHSVTDGRLLFTTRSAGLVDPALSYDGNLLAVCPAGGTPQVWDTAQNRRLSGGWERANGACDSGNSAVLLGGGRLAVVSTMGMDVWDVSTGREVAYLDDPGATDAVFSADGAFLATTCHAEIRVWRLSSPETPVFRQPLNNQQLRGELAWAADRPALRYVEGGTVHTIDLTTAVTPDWHAKPLANAVLSPDGHVLVTAERTGAAHTFRLLNTANGRLIRTLPAPPVPVSLDRTMPVVPQDTLALMAFSPDGTTLAYGVSTPGRLSAQQRFVVWDLAGSHVRTTLDLATSRNVDSVTAIALGPGGRSLYAARTAAPGTPTDEVWDTIHPGHPKILTGLSATHMVVRPDDRDLIGDNRTMGLPFGKVTQQDLVTGQEIGALAYSRDGSLLAAGDQTGRVALWDGGVHERKGLLANVFPTPVGSTQNPEAVSALALSPDGRTLAVGGDTGTLQLWDTATLQPLGGPLTTPGDAISSLAFSADNRTLYASSAHVPIQRYTVDAARAATRVCGRIGGGILTRAQWKTYIPDVSYRRVCP
ncbi:hypothetical protein ACFWOB_36880 [Streptomyces sp. NPDC058420]|uniref:nSTAND1 domain-containing NTPase n=1 Tax=Streptomyces sp. NPDC058420 TaxID=3346489 RepID=UPI0036693493